MWSTPCAETEEVSVSAHKYQVWRLPGYGDVCTLWSSRLHMQLTRPRRPHCLLSPDRLASPPTFQHRVRTGQGLDSATCLDYSLVVSGEMSDPRVSERKTWVPSRACVAFGLYESVSPLADRAVTVGER